MYSLWRNLRRKFTITVINKLYHHNNFLNIVYVFYENNLKKKKFIYIYSADIGVTPHRLRNPLLMSSKMNNGNDKCKVRKGHG